MPGDHTKSESNQGLHHIDDLERAVEEVCSVADPEVQRALEQSWDLPADMVSEGVRLYVVALLTAINEERFAPVEEYLIGLDTLWNADEFAISPLIQSLFAIQDAACQAIPARDDVHRQQLSGLASVYTRKAIACLSERSVSVVVNRLADQVDDHREGEARLMSLQRVGSVLVSDLDLDRSLQLIADEACKLIEADGVVIRMIDEEGELEFIAGSGNESLFLRSARLSTDSSLSGEAVRSRLPQCVNDIRTDERVNRMYLNVSDSRSLLVVPLISRERPIGVISGTSTRAGAFTDRDISILSLFADQAANAIENAQLFQQAQQQIGELEALHRVSQLVSSSLDLEQIFQTLYEEVARLMPADCFLVALARPDGLHDFEFIIDDARRFPPRRALPLSPILSEPLSAGEMFIQRDVTRHPQYPSANRFGNHERQARSVLAAPLMRGDQVLGMVSAQSYTEHDYRDPDARMLRTIASQAAIAIEHARLYREAQNVAVAEERARLAREIHDTLAQGLVGVILCLERLDLSIPADDACYRPWVERALELSRSSLEEARRSVRDLRAAPLEGRTLLEAMANLVADVQDDQVFTVQASLPASLPGLSARVETALFRVVQEAISNASKHAGCSELNISFSVDESVLRVEIEDDGNGFELRKQPEQPGHYGLMTMRERMLQIGGYLNIESSPGAGTSVRVELPIHVAMHQESRGFTDDSGMKE
jgi:signal transduction histidine kinase